MGKVISVINMKGGVGKTTLTLGIGEYLAHYKNKKVLFIDVDPQFNLTQTLMNEYNLEDLYMNEYTLEKNNRTVMRLFQSQTTISKKIELPNPEEVIITLDNYIDIIPGTIDLILVESDDGSKARRLRKFIKENNLREFYDYIFIDCPPTITVYSNAALIASDYYLVPNRIDRYSVLGIKLLKQSIDRLKDNEEIDIKPLGIVYTMVDEDLKKAEGVREVFENNDIVHIMGLFESKVKYNNNLLVGAQGNIASKYKKTSEDMEKIVPEFLRRIGDNE